MHDELVKRLRIAAQLADKGLVITPSICLESADAIEELICEVADEHNARLDAEERPRWIPVTERLPEENAQCIVYNKDYGPMVGWRVDGERFRIPGSRFPDHPTHWMPLPEPPVEE